jgi:hypothetical protein
MTVSLATIRDGVLAYPDAIPSQPYTSANERTVADTGSCIKTTRTSPFGLQGASGWYGVGLRSEFMDGIRLTRGNARMSVESVRGDVGGIVGGFV